MAESSQFVEAQARALLEPLGALSVAGPTHLVELLGALSLAGPTQFVELLGAMSVA